MSYLRDEGHRDMTQRFGCYYCFQTLDPENTRPGASSFLRCSQCQAVYHNACWPEQGSCLRCGGGQTTPIQVTRPSSLRPLKLTTAVPVRPSTVVYVQDSGSKSLIPALAWKRGALHVLQVIRALVITLLLVFAATATAVHIPRLINQDGYTFQSVMDLIFRGRMPAVPLWSGALVAALSSALIFYVHDTSARGNGRPSGITRFAAGVLIVAWFDLAFYNILTLDVLNQYIELRAAPDLWIAQGVAFFIVVLLTPIYRKLAPITPLPVYSERSSWKANLYGWGRLVVVTMLLVVASAYASIGILPQLENRPEVTTIGVGSIELSITLPFVGAALAALAVAALIFRSPPIRRVTHQLIAVRLLLFVVAGIALGLLYQDIATPDGYLNAIILGVSLALFSVPVQRTLS